MVFISQDVLAASHVLINTTVPTMEIAHRSPDHMQFAQPGWWIARQRDDVGRKSI